MHLAPVNSRTNSAKRGLNFMTYLVVLLSSLLCAEIEVALPGQITVSRSTTPSGVNLTQEGSTDWIHWGLKGVTAVTRKSGGGAQIGNYNQIGDVSARRYDENIVRYGWSDGTLTGSVAGTRAGIWIQGLGNGFEITAPADTTLQTLKVYVGVWAAQGLLEVSLSDGSAKPYVDTSLDNLKETNNGIYTVTYQAASAGQTVRVKFTVSKSYRSNGNVTLQAAALQNGSLSPLLGISGDAFTINEQPTFLLGVSYFDALGYKDSDLDELESRGFNLIRIWLDWAVWVDRSRSFFDADGNFIHASTALNLLRAAAARGIMVDVTILNSASTFDDFAKVERAIRSAVAALKDEPNVFFDLVNEHNLENRAASRWSVSHDNMRYLMEAAKQEGPDAILTFSTSSQGRHILTSDKKVNSINVNEELDAGIQILTPHLSRTNDWYERTDQRLATIKAFLASIGRSIPVYLQEERRRNFENLSNPTRAEFLQAAQEARDAGAAGWVFHTNAGFDLSETVTFFGNLDAEEKGIVDALGPEIFGS